MKAKLLFLCMLIALSACKKEMTTTPGTNPPTNTNTDPREKFIASYTIEEQCTVMGQAHGSEYVLTVTKGTAENGLVLKNFLGEGWDVSATVSNSDFTIPAQDQDYMGDPVTVTGTGKINGTTLTYNWTMAAKSGQWTANCSDTGGKK